MGSMYPYEADISLEGYLTGSAGPTGLGILMCPEWWGLNDHMKQLADKIASDLHAVVFLIDMYGDAQHTTEVAKATELYQSVMGTPLMRSRSQAGLDILAAQPGLDTDKIIGMGYCFGGTVCLELAYEDAPLAGIVTFHGGLVDPGPDDAISAKFLICHGAADSHIPPEAVASAQKAWTDKKVDWQMNFYGHAEHAFTNPHADPQKVPGTRYNKDADVRSYADMQRFVAEIVGS